MARRWGIFLLIMLLAQGFAAAQKQQEPPEEDESVAVAKQYTFNPLQAEKELNVGKFYFKKGSFRAAQQRFKEATMWNGSFAEAYLRLGEASEKLKDYKAARSAYSKYAEIEDDEKKVKEARERLSKLPADKGK
jgi:tetratricopeptide (TPR) repeat protein